MIIKTKSDRWGNHIHCRVFVGPDSRHLALSGTLVFDPDQWELVRGISTDIPGVMVFSEGYLTMGKDGELIES